MADYCEPYSLIIEQEHAVSIDAEPDIMLITSGEQGPPGPPGLDAPGAGGAPIISADADNQITAGTDGGLFAPQPQLASSNW